MLLLKSAALIPLGIPVLYFWIIPLATEWSGITVNLSVFFCLILISSFEICSVRKRFKSENLKPM
jgi:hypothetical protein